MLQFYLRLKVYLIIVAITIAVLSSAANSKTNAGHMISISLDSSLSLEVIKKLINDKVESQGNHKIT